MTLEEMIRAVSRLPAPTQREREELLFSHTYGNLALSTNHQPVRDAFKRLAESRGWTDEQFDAWALGRTWRAE